jgi:cytochrome b involved in lipid metabolism
MAAAKLKLEKDEENLKNKIYLNNINRSNLLKKLISTQLAASNSMMMLKIFINKLLLKIIKIKNYNLI